MARVIWHNENHDNENLKGMNFTNAFINGGSYKGTKFGNCTNATFIVIPDIFDDKTIFDDLTGAEFIGEITPVKRFIKSLNIIPNHSHKLIAAKFAVEAEGETDPETKERGLHIAEFINAHPELSWKAFVRYFNYTTGWYPDKKLMRFILKVVSKVLFGKRTIRDLMRAKYPDIPEEEWQ